MNMYRKIGIIVFLILLGKLNSLSQNALVEITPTKVLKQGHIVVKIDSLKSSKIDRLILFPLPIKLTDNALPAFHVSRDFNGIWYVDSAETKLWIGKILKAKETTWAMEMNLENLMTEESRNSYTLTICSNYDSKGLDFFISDRGKTEIVYANTLVFKGGDNHNNLKCEPENVWKNASSLKTKIYHFNRENEEYSHLTFEVANADNITAYITNLIISFIALFWAAYQISIRKHLRSKFLWIVLAFIFCSISILVSCYLNGIIVSFKNVLNVLILIIGAISGYYFGRKSLEVHE